MSTRSFLLATLAAVSLVFAGCGGDDAAEDTDDAEPTTDSTTDSATDSAGTEVEVVDFTFSPDTVTVPAGSSLTFTNSDGTTHTATALDGEFDTGDIAGGSTASVTLDEAGEIDYRCEIHQSMTGTVVVSNE